MPEYVSHYPDSNGQWILGKKYREKCKFEHAHGCCGPMTQSLHFLFDDDKLNRYSVKTSISEKLHGKNITILGDSLQLLFFEGLAEVLDLSSQKRLVWNFKGNDNNKSASWTAVEHKSGGWLQYLYFYYYSDMVKGCKGTHGDRFKVDENVMRRVIATSDIIIANLGLHYHFCSVGAYGESLRLLSELLQEEVSKHKHKQVILRATLPQHFISKSNTGFFEKYNPNATCAKVISRVENPTNALLREAARTHGFKYLDNYHIYKGRYDMHSLIKKGDCTHYCYSPELTIPELTLLDQLLL